MLDDIEVVLLTGGASRRMGEDKASLRIEGEAMGDRLVRLCREAELCVTVVGRESIEGAEFLCDRAKFEGPLVALGQFVPKAEYVFTMSCDLPRFEVELIGLLYEEFDDEVDALMPCLDGRIQPLVGLYRAEAWVQLQSCLECGEKRLMSWVDRLSIKSLSGAEIEARGGHVRWFMSANSPTELQRILAV
jgi:molybdenum cofactor guanylyltransferase